MNKSNRVNLFTGKLIKPIDISDAGLKRIAVALCELPPLECEHDNREILENCCKIMSAATVATKIKSNKVTPWVDLPDYNLEFLQCHLHP